MKRLNGTVVVGMVLALVCVPLSVGFAQTSSTGALVGVVSDRTGSVLPGVEITLTNEQTGETRTASTRDNGNYEFSLLPPGFYRLEATRKGFKTATRSRIVIVVTETSKLDFQLEIGELAQKVTVEAAPIMVQTESVALGRVTNETAVVNLPLVTRNYTQIIGLSPGVSTTVTNAGELGRGSGGVASIESTLDGTFVHGARSYDNNYQMDGISINDAQASGVGSGGVAIPNPDTIAEFKVQTGLYDASYGRYAGASVNVVTKGGANEFHGTVFEFFRNDVLNANDFFLNSTGQKRPVLKQSQFGFTLGGPVKRDKLLFFGSYQGTRQVNGLATGQARVGCKATLTTPPLTNDRSRVALGALFGGQSGALGGVAVAPDGSNINPVALALLNLKLPDGSFLIPSPQVIDPSQSFESQGFSAFSDPCRFNEDQFMTNFDYLQSSKSKFAFRFFFAKSDDLVTFAGGAVNSVGNVRGFPDSTDSGFRNFSLTHTYVASSNLFNEARFGFVRTRAELKARSPFKWSDVGAAEGALSLNDALPNLNILGSINFATGFPRQFAQNQFSFSDNLSYIAGSHSLRFGGSLTRLQDNLNKVGIGSFVLFLSWPDFLLGLDGASNGTTLFSNVFASVDAFGLLDRSYRAWEGSLYAQDNYRVAPRLNLGLGVRYERLGQLCDELGRNGSFDFNRANPNPPLSGSLDGYVVASNFHGSPPPGVIRSGNCSANDGDGQNTIAPRVGLAWQVLPRSNRLVVRTGYGMYYSRPTGQAFYQNIFGAPFTLVRVSIATANASATFQNPFAQPFPTTSSFPLFPPYSPNSETSVFTTALNYRSAIIQQYSFNVQSQLAPDLLLEVGYVGTRGTHLQRQRSLNQALLASPTNLIRGEKINTVANIPLRVPIEGIPPDGLEVTESGGASWYNALEASITKRLSHGLQFLGSYTFSKTLDTDGADVSGTAAGNSLTQGDQNNPSQRRGRASFDRTHRFTFSGVYSLPSPIDLNTFKGRILGGWNVAGVLTVQSGTALTILNTNANNVFGISEDRAQIAAGCSASQLVTHGSVNGKLNNYFNTACFTNPPVVGDDGIATAFGNSGTGIVNGPAQQNLDLAIIKRTSVNWPSERANLEFRTEFFNTFNTPQFANPDTNVSSSTFGKITSTSVNPRIVQFALKFNF